MVRDSARPGGRQGQEHSTRSDERAEAGLDVNINIPEVQQQFGANVSAIGFAMSVFDSDSEQTSQSRSVIPGDDATMSNIRSLECFQLHLPPRPLLYAFIEAYFDRAHWFIMLFHQPSFLSQCEHILSQSSWSRHELSSLLVLVMVAATGLQCAIHDESWAGHRLLESAKLNPHTVLQQLVSQTRQHLIDVLDDCSLETVQVCILLGSFYIYHGSPGLAWSILGLSVRTAYAVALHCDSSADPNSQILDQVRRRTWNHVTVADTFAATIDGRPSCLDAAFSALRPLSEMDDTTVGQEIGQDRLHLSLLTFHDFKFKLYQIIRNTISSFKLVRGREVQSSDDLAAIGLEIGKTQSALRDWREALGQHPRDPAWLDSDPWTESERTFGGLDMTDASKQIIRRQVAVLQLTYNGALILAHRPLLKKNTKATALDLPDALNDAIDAALRISRCRIVYLEHHLAASFAFMHFFTAGVVLCIAPARLPLSSTAQDAKAGVLRMIHATRKMSHASQVAQHTSQILTDLLKLTIQRELDRALDRPAHEESTALPRARAKTSNAHTDISRPADGPVSANFHGGTGDFPTPPISNRDEVYDPSRSGTDTRPHWGTSDNTGSHQDTVFTSASPRTNTFSDIDMIAGPETESTLDDWDVRCPPRSAGPGHGNVNSFDEVLGTFGEMMFNLVPDDPSNAWTWDNTLG